DSDTPCTRSTPASTTSRAKYRMNRFTTEWAALRWRSGGEQGGGEAVAGRQVDVLAVLDRPAGGVVGGALHGQQRHFRLLLQQPRLGRGGDPGADLLVRHVDLHPALAQRVVETGLTQLFVAGCDVQGQV